MALKPTFDLVVVGCGGGPDETNLSAYLLKSHNANWQDGIIALEAGSAQGTLSHLMTSDPFLFRSNKLECTGAPLSSSDIYSFVRCFLLTHAHLDHINGLVISAGSLRGPRKRVYALKQTLKDLELVFSDRIWPNLASWKEDDDDVKLLYSTLLSNGNYQPVSTDISVKTMPINHGQNTLGHYSSAAFFIKHEPSSREFLFFGDVEPDSITDSPQTINVWRAAASKIPDRLSTIFIECSWPSGRKDAMLFGHLTPEHLVDELEVLAKEVISHKNTLIQTQARRRGPPRKKQKRNSLTSQDLKDALSGVTIYIIHCKDDMRKDTTQHVRYLILDQVSSLVEQRGLGAKVLLAEQGSVIEIS